MRAALVLILLLAAVACGGQESDGSAAPRDCLAAWNDDDNPHRAGVPETMGVASVERDADRCDYVFHDWGRFVSYGGSWGDDGLEWEPEQRGAWTAERQRAARDDHTVAADRRLSPLAEASRSWGRWCKPVGQDARRTFELCREPPERPGAQARWVNPGALVVAEAGTRSVVRLEPPSRPEDTGDTPLAGHWERALLSPDGRWLLLEWSAECEVPYTFFAKPDEGSPRPVLRAPGAWWDAPSSKVVEWESASTAIVELQPSACGRGAVRRRVRVPVPS